jgi:hypothetical protein
MIKFLKLSILILLSHHVIYSQQFEPCLASASNKRLNDGYSFALAKVQDTSAVSGPQEACYYSCGARLVTYSNNKGDMKKLTAIDKAMPHLTLIKFLKAGQSYFVVCKIKQRVNFFSFTKLYYLCVSIESFRRK